MHNIWIFFVLLMIGCGGGRNSLNEGAVVSIGDKFFYDVPVDKEVVVYGYLVSSDHGSLIFPDKDMSHITVSENYNISARLWYLDKKFDEECFDSHVMVKGKKYYYAGVASLDEISHIYSMEGEGILCYSVGDPVNIFEKNVDKS